MHCYYFLKFIYFYSKGLLWEPCSLCAICPALGNLWVWVYSCILQLSVSWMIIRCFDFPKIWTVHRIIRAIIQILCTKTINKRKGGLPEISGKYLISLFLFSSLFLFWYKEFWITILIINYILGKCKHLIRYMLGCTSLWLFKLVRCRTNVFIHC